MCLGCGNGIISDENRTGRSDERPDFLLSVFLFNPEILRSKVKRLIQNRIDLKQMYMKLMRIS